MIVELLYHTYLAVRGETTDEMFNEPPVEITELVVSWDFWRGGGPIRFNSLDSYDMRRSFYEIHISLLSLLFFSYSISLEGTV